MFFQTASSMMNPFIRRWGCVLRRPKSFRVLYKAQKHISTFGRKSFQKWQIFYNSQEREYEGRGCSSCDE